MSGIQISVQEGDIKIKIPNTLLKRDTGLQELGSILVLLQNKSLVTPFLETLEKELGKELSDEVMAYATIMEMTTNGFSDVQEWTKPVIPASNIPEDQ